MESSVQRPGARTIDITGPVRPPTARTYSTENVLTPEVVDPRIADVEAVARWFDYAFRLPGGFRFGLSGIIGFIPGIGDVIDALISLYIVGRAIQLRIPRVAVARMVMNVAIEGLLGTLPFVGDLFLIGWKANRRNYRLLKLHLAGAARQTTRDWWFLAITVMLLVAAVVLPLVVLIFLLRRL